MQISPSTARRFVLTRQHLAGPRVEPTAAGIVRLVRDLKYVQLDPTSAVARSHLLVLWSRLGPYDPALLDRLLWKSRRLLEYSAFIVPAEDYAIYRPGCESSRQATRPGDAACGLDGKKFKIAPARPVGAQDSRAPGIS
jgi:hypothetical protein